MCGFVGFVGTNYLNDTNKALLEISYRGPDAKGIWLDKKNNVGLGHNRLSIIDISNRNNQPFLSENKKVVLVFNGEIYNYIEVREILKKKGIKFKTDGDTEVLIKSYLFWGDKFLKYLEGMWAFAIYDFRDNNNPFILICRDRCGEKPLYYSIIDNFKFGSELKTIKNNNILDLKSVNYYLFNGFSPSDHSIFANIKKLPPACMAKYYIKTKKFTLNKYWNININHNKNDKKPFKDIIMDSWSLFNESVDKKLRSDVPVGLFLSGGLDSSLILSAIASKKNKIKTFTVNDPKINNQEIKRALYLSKFYGTEHHVMNIEEFSPNIILEILDKLDEPFGDTSLIPTFLLSKKAKSKVTVALGGDGGDEIFGGYGHYNSYQRFKYFSKVISLLGYFGSSISEKFPAGYKGRGLISNLKYGALFNLFNKPFYDSFLRKKILNEKATLRIGEDFDSPENSIFEFLNKKDLLNSILLKDFSHYLPEDILFKVDRSSMYNSLEIRSPYLDSKLIKFMFENVHSKYKVNFFNTRIIQRAWAKRFLPKNFEIGKKQGFSIDTSKFLNKSILNTCLDLLPGEIFDLKYLEKLINDYEAGASNSARLFSMLTLSHSLK